MPDLLFQTERSAQSRMPTWVPWLIAMATICALARFGVFLVDEPRIFPDSGRYLELARFISHGFTGAFDGARTPGYPMLLALVPDLRWLQAVQLTAGIATSVTMFAIVMILTNNPMVSALSGLFYGINLNQISFESAVLTETTGSLLLIVSPLIFTLVVANRLTISRMGLVAVLGLVCALAILTKPLLIVDTDPESRSRGYARS